MAKKTAEKVDKHDPALRKRHYTYLFWAAVVIAVSLVQMITKNPIVTVAQFGVAVLALFQLLRLDGNFMRVHKAFRSASSIETAKIQHVQKHNEALAAMAHDDVDGALANKNMNSKLAKRNRVED